jgi:hypothetical protein
MTGYAAFGKSLFLFFPGLDRIVISV